MDPPPSPTISNSSMLWTPRYFSLIINLPKPQPERPGAREDYWVWRMRCLVGEGTLPSSLLLQLLFWWGTFLTSGKVWTFCNILSSERFGGRICFSPSVFGTTAPLSVWWNWLVLEQQESEAFFFFIVFTCTLCKTQFNANTSSFVTAPLTACSVPPLPLLYFMKRNAGWVPLHLLIADWLVMAAAERAMRCGWCSARRAWRVHARLAVPGPGMTDTYV